MHQWGWEWGPAHKQREAEQHRKGCWLAGVTAGESLREKWNGRKRSRGWCVTRQGKLAVSLEQYIHWSRNGRRQPLEGGSNRYSLEGLWCINRNKGGRERKSETMHYTNINPLRSERFCKLLPGVVAVQRCFFLTSRNTPPCNLPEDESKTVHVSHDVRLEMISVQAFIQHFWRHIALGTHPCVGWDVNLICVTGGKQSKALSALERLLWLSGKAHQWQCGEKNFQWTKHFLKNIS